MTSFKAVLEDRKQIDLLVEIQIGPFSELLEVGRASIWYSQGASAVTENDLEFSQVITVYKRPGLNNDNAIFITVSKSQYFTWFCSFVWSSGARAQSVAKNEVCGI